MLDSLYEKKPSIVSDKQSAPQQWPEANINEMDAPLCGSKSAWRSMAIHSIRQKKKLDP